MDEEVLGESLIPVINRLQDIFNQVGVEDTGRKLIVCREVEVDIHPVCFSLLETQPP